MHFHGSPDNQTRLWHKLGSLVIATILLVPLLYFKSHLGGALYLFILLALHAYILYTYLHHLKKQAWLKQPADLIIRILGVIFFAFLLANLKFSGSISQILINLSAATIVHAAILFILYNKFTIVSPRN